MSLAQIVAVVGGAVHDDRDAARVTGPAFVDSRVAELGGLFAAFDGEHADGHDYAEVAVQAGAAAVLAARPVGVPAVVVADVQEALSRLARHVLDALPDVRVVALTGSSGKTSTKDLMAAVLADAAPTVATYGSFNNEIGLPLTVLRAEAGTRYLVAEMGARGTGHLRDLCRVAPPDVAVVLNVGKAHLGEFGSVERIAAAKGEVVEALGDDGTAVLNADDPAVAAMAQRTTARVLTWGQHARSDVRVDGLRLDDRGRPAFRLTTRDGSVPVSMSLYGEHQAANAAAAATAALALGVPLETAAASLGRVQGLSKWRMEVHELADGVTVINDAYNANPDSMRAALKALAAMGRGRSRGRTVAVLGEMRELGESSREEHDAVGRLAVRLDIRQLLVVGDAARAIHLGACLEGSWGEESVFVPTRDDAVAWLGQHISPGDVVLVKASNGARLYDVAEALVARGGVGGAA